LESKEILEKSLEDFLISESLNLEIIEKELNSFNPFSVLRIGHKELQHSNFIAWLLESNGNHHLEDYFLKSFLSLISSISSEQKIQLYLQDLKETIIYREWNNIDIVIANEKLKTVIIIENKVWAKLSFKQLQNYFEQAENFWDDSWKKHYVYLTALPRTLHEDDRNIGYENIHYGQILEILEKIISELSLNEEIAQFIQQYIDNLKINIMGDSNPQELARQIYLKHKTAIDFIVSQKPVVYSRKRFELIKDYFNKHLDYELFNTSRTNFLSILPKSISSHFKVEGFHSWYRDKPDDICPMMMIEFWLEEKRLYIKFCLGRIWNEEKEEELQMIKNDYFNDIRSFESLKKNKKIHFASTKPKYNYVNLVHMDLFRVENKAFLEAPDFMEFFEKKFKEFEKEVITPFIEEVENSKVISNG